MTEEMEKRIAKLERQMKGLIAKVVQLSQTEVTAKKPESIWNLNERKKALVKARDDLWVGIQHYKPEQRPEEWEKFREVKRKIEEADRLIAGLDN